MIDEHYCLVSVNNIEFLDETFPDVGPLEPDQRHIIINVTVKNIEGTTTHLGFGDLKLRSGETFVHLERLGSGLGPSVLFKDIEPGETLTANVAYMVDDDQGEWELELTDDVRIPIREGDAVE